MRYFLVLAVCMFCVMGSSNAQSAAENLSESELAELLNSNTDLSENQKLDYAQDYEAFRSYLGERIAEDGASVVLGSSDVDVVYEDPNDAAYNESQKSSPTKISRNELATSIVEDWNSESKEVILSKLKSEYGNEIPEEELIQLSADKTFFTEYFGLNAEKQSASGKSSQDYSAKDSRRIVRHGNNSWTNKNAPTEEEGKAALAEQIAKHDALVKESRRNYERARANNSTKMEENPDAPYYLYKGIKDPEKAKEAYLKDTKNN